MPMTVCEEAVDISWVGSRKAKMLSEKIRCTDVGPVRGQLGKKLIQYVNVELVESPGWKSLAGCIPHGMTILGRMRASRFSTTGVRLVYSQIPKVITGSMTALPRHGLE